MTAPVCTLAKVPRIGLRNRLARQALATQERCLVIPLEAVLLDLLLQVAGEAGKGCTPPPCYRGPILSHTRVEDRIVFNDQIHEVLEGLLQGRGSLRAGSLGSQIRLNSRKFTQIQLAKLG